MLRQIRKTTKTPPLRCGQKYVETSSSSNAVAQNPEERVQMNITHNRNTYIHTSILHTYLICLYTVKSLVYITIKSFITTTLFYKIAMWEPNRKLLYSWSISLLKYPRESDFRKLKVKLFHNSAPL